MARLASKDGLLIHRCELIHGCVDEGVLLVVHHVLVERGRSVQVLISSDLRTCLEIWLAIREGC